jgi:hypothetical protein
MAGFVLNERLRPSVLGAVSLGLCGVVLSGVLSGVRAAIFDLSD